ncbi:MAG: hypothetical protein U0670_05280 [Anaerolineae bacterium]
MIEAWGKRFNGRLAFRWLAVGCQAATIVVTWRLWQVRSLPPLLPAIPLPSFDMGALLLLSLAIFLVRPRVGWITHAGLLLYAMLMDQTRIQPQMISLAVLMLGTIPQKAAQSTARMYLVALWTWAGLNKLLSPVFIIATGRMMTSILFPFLPDVILQFSGYAIALTELSIGVMTFVPRTRKVAAVVAFGLHVGILLTLIRMEWNSSVWAWNVALAFAGFALVWPWHENSVAMLRANGWIVRLAAAVMLIAPVGFMWVRSMPICRSTCILRIRRMRTRRFPRISHGRR